MREGRTVVSVPSHPKYLCVVRAVTEKFGKVSGLDDMIMEDIKLAVDEACTNVIKHAYKGDASKKIVVKYRVTGKGFEVVIEDSGSKSQIEFMQGRSLDDIRPGGLGMHLIRKAFDSCRFDERKKKGNRLILRRLTGKKDEHRDRGL